MKSTLTSHEKKILSAYRKMRDDPALNDKFTEDLQEIINLPKGRTLTLTLCNPANVVDFGDDEDRDPRGDDYSP